MKFGQLVVGSFSLKMIKNDAVFEMCSDCEDMVLLTAIQASPGNLMEMQVLMFHHWSVESEIPWVGRNLDRALQLILI